MNTKFRLLGGVAITVLTMAATPAKAQILNYAEWEDLFGEPVTTSATGSPMRRSEVPVTMDIVTADDIRRSGATSIPQILSTLAGIDVYTWSNNSADVAVRGLNQGASNRLLVLVNGREMYTDALGTLLWQTIPVRLDEIRQIEVIKGPNSALYGFNAAAGVVNIITYNPQYDNIKAERVTIGTDGHQEYSVVRTGQWEGGGLRLSGGYSDVPEDNFHPAWSGDRDAVANPSISRTLNADFQQQLGTATQLHLQEALSSGNLRTEYVMPVFLNMQLLMSEATLASDTRLGSIEFNLMNNHYNMGSFVNSLAAGKLSNDVTVAKLQDLFKLDASDTIRVATEYRRDAMPTYPLHGGDLLSQTGAVSGMWEHAFSKDLTLLTALRGDDFSLSRTGPVMPLAYTNAQFDRSIEDWSFNSAVTYRPTGLDSLRVSAARGLQLPSLTEFGEQNQYIVPFQPPYLPYATVESTGNPTLNPTRVMHYEVSYDRRVPSLDIDGRASLYHQDITGMHDLATATTLAQIYPTPILLAPYTTAGNASLNGIELELKGKVAGNLRWGANYTYEAVTATADQYHDFSKSTPTHKFNLILDYATGPWEFDGRLRYVSQTQMPEQVYPGQYALFRVGTVWVPSLRAAYHFNPRLRVEANAIGSFADNAIAGQKAQALVSVIANY